MTGHKYKRDGVVVASQIWLYCWKMARLKDDCNGIYGFFGASISPQGGGAVGDAALCCTAPSGRFRLWRTSQRRLILPDGGGIIPVHAVALKRQIQKSYCLSFLRSTAILGLVQVRQVPSYIICGSVRRGILIPWGWGWLHRSWSFAIRKPSAGSGGALRLRLPPGIEPCEKSTFFSLPPLAGTARRQVRIDPSIRLWRPRGDDETALGVTR